MNEETIIYVVGWIGKGGGNGGFEWDTERSRIEAVRADYLSGTLGAYDVAEIHEVTLDQLALDGNYTNEAITDALDQWPEAWEPPKAPLGTTWIGRVDGRSIRLPSEAAAAEVLAVIERHDPEGVERGDYFIDVERGEE